MKLTGLHKFLFLFWRRPKLLHNTGIALIRLSSWLFQYRNLLNWLCNCELHALVCVNVIYSMYVTTPKVHISVGKETKSKFTTSGAKNSGVPNETLSFSRGLYLKRDKEKSHLNHKNKPWLYYLNSQRINTFRNTQWSLERYVRQMSCQQKWLMTTLIFIWTHKHASTSTIQ